MFEATAYTIGEKGHLTLAVCPRLATDASVTSFGHDSWESSPCVETFRFSSCTESSANECSNMICMYHQSSHFLTSSYTISCQILSKTGKVSQHIRKTFSVLIYLKFFQVQFKVNHFKVE